MQKLMITVGALGGALVGFRLTNKYTEQYRAEMIVKAMEEADRRQGKDAVDEAAATRRQSAFHEESTSST